MNYKKLEQLTELYKEIRSLDDEIIRLNKTAMKIAESGSMVDFKLTIVDKKMEIKTPVLDANGDLSKPETYGFSPLAGLFSYSIGTAKSSKPKVKSDIKERITDVSALQIMAILLSEKNDRRAKLVH